MRPSSLYRICGPVIVGSGLLLLTAFAFRPPQPEAIAGAADLALDKWVLANWMFAVGFVLLLAGWIGLTEHLNETGADGWSTIGLGGVIVGCVGLAITGAVSAESLPKLMDSFTQGDAAIADQAFFTIYTITSALSLMSWTILWIGTALTGLSLAEDVHYPPVLGYAGLAIAALEISTLLMPESSVLYDVFGMLGCVWLIAVGVVFTRITSVAKTVTAVPHEPVTM